MKHEEAMDGDTAWKVCVVYSSGTEKVLWFCRNREAGLRSIDFLYGYGYPLHFAYVLRKVTSSKELNTKAYVHPSIHLVLRKAMTLTQTTAWYS